MTRSFVDEFNRLRARQHLAAAGSAEKASADASGQLPDRCQPSGTCERQNALGARQVPQAADVSVLAGVEIDRDGVHEAKTKRAS